MKREDIGKKFQVSDNLISTSVFTFSPCFSVVKTSPIPQSAHDPHHDLSPSKTLSPLPASTHG